MRTFLILTALTLLTLPLRADPAHITAITKDARHSGTLSITNVEITTPSGLVKVPLPDVAFIQFSDTDSIKTRQGKRIKGTIKTETWTLQQPDSQLPLSHPDLRYFIPQIPLSSPKKAQVVDAATANGMIYHVRLPAKYNPKTGLPAIVLLHGSNANSADYLLGISQRWPRIAADYILIGIDGEWPAQKDPDGPPAFNYTYINFVGKSKYKGFPGSDRESPALVAEAVAEIKQQLKLTKIFVTGHSQGGFLAYSCLMNYPDLFAGAMPISAGLIFQCEPTAYEDPEIRKLQRTRPIAILHGEQDPLVAVSMAKSAYDSFLYDGFPMLRLFLAKQSGHAFISLPFEEGIRWLESMSSDDPRALQASADRAFAQREYRDCLAYLQRAQDLAPLTPAAKTLRQKIEQLAAAPAKTLEPAIRKAESNAWLPAFDAFRRQFEFTDAAAPVMAEYAKLHKLHEAPAEKLWTDTRKVFQDGNKDQGYRLCEQIVSTYYASTYYRYARQTLDERH
jgi:predicted esterase